MNSPVLDESIWRSAPGIGDAAPPGPGDAPVAEAAAVTVAATVTALRARPERCGPAGSPRAAESVDEPVAGVELAAPPIDVSADLSADLSADVSEEPAWPVPQLQQSRPLAGPRLESSFTRSVWSWEPVSDVEASSFAGRFACDFQSFDQDAPWRRAEVLREVLADAQACTWGWSGSGRQRADSPLPGRIYRRSATVVFVEVVVRVTSYVRAGAVAGADGHPENDGERGEWGEPAGMIGRSCAPPEADSAWAAAQAWWVRMTVPVTRAGEDGRLVVDPGLLSGPAGEQAGER
ncbi:hypothetical protein Ae406Ps2_6269 [Pseudonocardia sp. Ae406_Ps2]|nr:hypothetical protein Ae406Ps2_6269 [Pseudonocardia sp. Ae406_Ps2]